MPKFSKAVIYKLINKVTNEVLYVGSSCNYNHRISEHESDCTNDQSKRYNLPIYKHVREIGGWEMVSHDIIESFPCETKTELMQREQEIINQFSGLKNVIRSYQSADERKAYNQQYEINRKGTRKEYNKQYEIDHADERKAYKKQYEIDNREKRNEQRRQRYLKKNQQKQEI